MQDDGAALESDFVDLVIQLSTRIGMIMEDVGPLALDASPDGLGARVGEIADGIRTLAALVRAAEALLGQ